MQWKLAERCLRNNNIAASSHILSKCLPLSCDILHFYHFPTLLNPNKAMAELVGLVLAVPPTVGLALKFSEYLYRKKRHIDAADQEIVTLSLDVRSFATNTDYSVKTLKRVCLKLRKSSSPVFKHLQAGGILEDLASQSRRTEGHINKAWDYTESVQSRFKIVTRWKWVVIKPDVMALRSDMRNLEVSLSLIINTINLEMTLASIPDSASREDIEDRDQKM